jgi:hypothetical protein
MIQRHWEFKIEYDDGRPAINLGAKSSGFGEDPILAAEHIMANPAYSGCAFVTARLLGTDEGHISIAFAQKPNARVLPGTKRRGKNKLLFNAAGQQVNERHQVVASDKETYNPNPTVAAIARAQARHDEEDAEAEDAVPIEELVSSCPWAKVDRNGNVVDWGPKPNTTVKNSTVTPAPAAPATAQAALEPQHTAEAPKVQEMAASDETKAIQAAVEQADAVKEPVKP